MASRLAPLLFLFLLAVACQRTMLKSSLVDAGGNDEFAEMDFWDGLAEARVVSNHDALHAMLLSFGGDKADDYAGRLAAAKKRKWIAEDDTPPANETARIGWVARAACIEAGIKGGLTMHLIGPDERYAVHELNYMGWLPKMSVNQAISGMQLIALLGAIEDAEQGGPDKPREDLR